MRDPAGRRLSLEEPGAMLALPGHHVAAVSKEVTALTKRPVRAAPAAGTILILINAHWVPEPYGARLGVIAPRRRHSRFRVLMYRYQ